MKAFRNNIFYGFTIAAVAPLIAVFFSEYTTLSERLIAKPLLLYALAGLVNLLFIRFFYKKQLTKTATGMVAMTFVAILVLLLFKRSITV